MPHISVYSYPGHSNLEKDRLAQRIRDAVMEEMGVEREAVSVSVREIEKENWKKEVYDSQIMKYQNDLEIRPGYKME